MHYRRRGHVALIFALALATGYAGTASAQIPVTDGAAIAQSTQAWLQQAASMLNQLTQLKAQLQQAQQQYQSITGSRGLGGIDQENYTAKLPTNWQQAVSSITGGTPAGQLAKQISDEASQLSQGYFKNVPADQVAAYQQQMNTAANAEGLNAEAFQNATDRFSRLQDLESQINQATDLKAINDLQARIQIEQVEVQNDIARTQAMNAMLAAQAQVQQQQQKQQEQQMLQTRYLENQY